jgi:hypothetical protein
VAGSESGGSRALVELDSWRKKTFSRELTLFPSLRAQPPHDVLHHLLLHALGVPPAVDALDLGPVDGREDLRDLAQKPHLFERRLRHATAGRHA